MTCLRAFTRQFAVRMSALVAIVALGAASAHAVPINYGDFSGTSIDFLQVTENSLTDATPLFGAPTVVDDSLVFTPLGFGASSSGGGVDITDGLVTTVVMATGGAPIVAVSLHEFGDYTLFGAGTAATAAAVSTPAFLTILQVNNADITPFNVGANAVFTPSGGTFNLVADPGIGVIWDGTLTFDVPAILAAHGIAGGATKAVLTLNNTLVAASEAGSVSFIQKKGVIIRTNVPEPSTIALSAMGLAAMALYGWRKRTAR